MEDRLRKLVSLVDAGSFTAAAEDMHVSQPALSVAIAKLERELKAPLIVRGIRPVTLTPAGRMAYDAGRDIIAKNANLKTRLAELMQQDLRVSVGMIDSVASTLLSSSQSIDNLERQAVVSLVVDNSRNLLQALVAGKLDLAFVVEQQAYDPALQGLETAHEPLVAVGAPTKQHDVHDDLRRFISYDQASSTHTLIMQELAANGHVIDPIFYCTSPTVILQLVLKGRGVATLPYLLVREHLERGELIRVGLPPLRVMRPIQAVKRRGVILPTPLERIVFEGMDLLRDLQVQAAGGDLLS